MPSRKNKTENVKMNSNSEKMQLLKEDEHEAVVICSLGDASCTEGEVSVACWGFDQYCPVRCGLGRVVWGGWLAQCNGSERAGSREPRAA